jgi:anti-sigma regulatory factor (Ser/Thr protein kinase)
MRRGWQFSSLRATEANRQRKAFVKYLRMCTAPDSDINGSAIIFGELVGNVVRHANGPIHVVLEWNGDAALLHVRDHGFGFQCDFQLPAIDSESGRGLFIVRELARSLTLDSTPHGCEVTAVLPINPGRNDTAPEPANT